MPSMAAADSGDRPLARKYYLDNFRSFLTALVIYHHTSIAYGGEGSVHYRSRHHLKPAPAILAFNVFNQSFFMAAFFFISGHLTSAATSNPRGSPWRLARSRLLRLGLPTLLYTITAEAVHVGTSRAILTHQPLDWSILQDSLLAIRGIRGPVWYCALLLIFDLVNIGLCSKIQMRSSIGCCHFEGPKKNNLSEKDSFNLAKPNIGLSNWGVLLALTTISIASFLIRVKFPVNKVFIPLNLRLGYLPHYLGYYIMGRLASYDLGEFVRDRVQDNLLTRLRPILLVVTATTTAAAAFIVGRQPSSSTPIQDPRILFSGGLNIPAAIYALWNESIGFLIFASLMVSFRRHFNHPLPLWPSAPRYSYASFLVHRPVSEAVEMVLDGWQVGAVAKTFFIGTINVALSWMVGWALLSRVL